VPELDDAAPDEDRVAEVVPELAGDSDDVLFVSVTCASRWVVGVRLASCRAVCGRRRCFTRIAGSVAFSAGSRSDACDALTTTVRDRVCRLRPEPPEAIAHEATATSTQTSASAPDQRTM